MTGQPTVENSVSVELTIFDNMSVVVTSILQSLSSIFFDKFYDIENSDHKAKEQKGAADLYEYIIVRIREVCKGVTGRGRWRARAW